MTPKTRIQVAYGSLLGVKAKVPGCPHCDPHNVAREVRLTLGEAIEDLKRADAELEAAHTAEQERASVIEYIELEARRIAKGGTLMDQRSAELFSALAVLLREGAHHPTKEEG